MNDTVSRPLRLEKLLAGLLHYGTWLASAAIALGLVLAFIDSRLGGSALAVLPSMRLATAGIVLLILLPALRVLLMLVFFLRHRDYRLAITAALVLTILVFGFILGSRTTSARAE
jgi:uncharacterized membrane protein